MNSDAESNNHMLGLALRSRQNLGHFKQFMQGDTRGKISWSTAPLGTGPITSQNACCMTLRGSVSSAAVHDRSLLDIIELSLQDEDLNIPHVEHGGQSGDSLVYQLRLTLHSLQPVEDHLGAVDLSHNGV